MESKYINEHECQKIFGKDWYTVTTSKNLPKKSGLLGTFIRKDLYAFMKYDEYKSIRDIMKVFDTTNIANMYSWVNNNHISKIKVGSNTRYLMSECIKHKRIDEEKHIFISTRSTQGIKLFNAGEAVEDIALKLDVTTCCVNVWLRKARENGPVVITPSHTRDVNMLPFHLLTGYTLQLT